MLVMMMMATMAIMMVMLDENDQCDDDRDGGDDDDDDDIEDKCVSTRSGRASLLNYNRLVNWPQLLFHYSDFYF